MACIVNGLYSRGLWRARGHACMQACMRTRWAGGCEAATRVAVTFLRSPSCDDDRLPGVIVMALYSYGPI